MLYCDCWRDFHDNKNYKLCFNNWFSTLKFMLKLRSVGILTTATIRANRTAGCPLLSENDLKKKWS